MTIISADQAREQSGSFDLSEQQVVADIAKTIDANSKAGKRSVTRSYLASAVSEQEFAAALDQVSGKGYTVELISVGDQEQRAVRISW